MAEIKLVDGVIQDGGAFYYMDHPTPIASYDCVKNDNDMAGAFEARRCLLRDWPEYAYVVEPPAPIFTTRDISLAIRDHLEGNTVTSTELPLASVRTMSAEIACPLCNVTLSIMLPPSGLHGGDEQRCERCGCSYWPGHDGTRHMPPQERGKLVVEAKFNA